MRKTISRRKALALMGGSLAATFISTRMNASSIPGTPRNLLFIIVDDLAPHLGCYGFKNARTPHIDALAGRGMRFDNAYCPYPLCGPSRTAVLTGARPEKIPMGNNEVCWREAHPCLATFPEIARKHGAESVRFGKVAHHGMPAGQERDEHIAKGKLPNTFADPLSWQIEQGAESDSKHLGSGEYRNFDGPKQAGTTLELVLGDDPDALYPDYQTASQAVAYLNSAGQKPFCLCLGFHKPHVPFVAPRRYWDRFPVDSIDWPQSIQATLPDAPPAAFFRDTPHRGMSEQQRKDVYRAYLATTAFTDDQVGRVMAALDANNLADSTLVVFVADHGYHLGEQAQWSKMTLFEASLRVPLVLAGAGIPHKGATCSEIVETTRLFSTITEIMGWPSPHKGEASLAPQIANPQATREGAARAWIQTGNRTGFTIRKGRYRYTEYGPKGAAGITLHDLADDPEQSRNLAALSDYQSQCEELAALLC